MKDLKSVKRIISELTEIMTKKQKKKSVIVFASMIICSLLELLSVSVIYPFLDAMVDMDNMSEKWYAHIIYKIWPEITPVTMVLFIGIIIIIVFLLKNCVALLCTYIQQKFSASFLRELSTLMLESYLKRPYEFFVNTNSAVIIRGINGDTSAAYQVMLSIFEFLTSFLTAVMIGVYLLYTDLFVAVGALLLAGICFLVIVYGFKKKLKYAGQAFIDANTKQFMYSYQAVNGIKEITVMDRRGIFIEQYEKASKIVEKLNVTNNFINACPDRILEGVCVGGFIGIACIRIAIGTDAIHFIPVLGAFALGAFKILPSISKMSSRINNIVYNQARLTICYDNIREARQIEKDNTGMREENTSSQYLTDSNKFVFENNIEIKDVVWRYKNSNDSVLNGLCLKINKGESIAFIGASGSGKTTLADMLLGLFKPQSGSISVDGTDIYSIPHEWAKTIGYVPQSVYLIDDTIKANVAFGIPEDMVQEDKVWDAISKAQLGDFVSGLPNGINTVVGERGVKFSGGQRQRIAIARALYENPEILILDEATSALDTETENAVMESIDALIGQKTLIIIAHRLTTIRNCDRVYEIKDGIAFERQKEEVL